MKKLLVIGAGGHGRVIADLAAEIGWVGIAFLDDCWPERRANAVWPIIGKIEDLDEHRDNFDGVFVALGKNADRLKHHQHISQSGCTVPYLVHPSAVLSSYVELASGTAVLAGVIINAFTHIGQACIINTSASIDHDCKLADGVHIGPGSHLAGTVSVGKCAFMGVGSAAVPNVAIGAGVVIGAGATVINDINPGITVIGSPARPKK